MASDVFIALDGGASKTAGAVMNNQSVHRVSLRFGVSGTEQLGSSQHRISLGREGSLPAEGQGVRVLYDPENPERCLWADSLALPQPKAQ
jgi:hypothetical protein